MLPQATDQNLATVSLPNSEVGIGIQLRPGNQKTQILWTPQLVTARLNQGKFSGKSFLEEIVHSEEHVETNQIWVQIQVTVHIYVTLAVVVQLQSCDQLFVTHGLIQNQLLESAQIPVHWLSDAIQPSNPLSSPSPPAFYLSQNQDFFQWVGSLNQVTKVLELQL